MVGNVDLSHFTPSIFHDSFKPAYISIIYNSVARYMFYHFNNSILSKQKSLTYLPLMTHSALRMPSACFLTGMLPPWFYFSRSLYSFAVLWRGSIARRKSVVWSCLIKPSQASVVPQANLITLSPGLPLSFRYLPLLSSFISLCPHLCLQCWAQGLAHDRHWINHCERMNGEWMNEWMAFEL